MSIFVFSWFQPDFHSSSDHLKINFSICKDTTMCLHLIGYTWHDFDVQTGGEGKKQISKETCFCCLNLESTAKGKFFFFICLSAVLDNSGFLPHIELISISSLTTLLFLCLLFPDSYEPGIHTFPLYFHCALVQT